MSSRSDRVVVPYAVFLERRERRGRVAATLRQRDRSAAADTNPSAQAVAIAVAGGQPTSAAAGKSECAADESVAVSSTVDGERGDRS